MKVFTCIYFVLTAVLLPEIMLSPVWPWAFAVSEAILLYWTVRLYREERREDD